MFEEELDKARNNKKYYEELFGQVYNIYEKSKEEEPRKLLLELLEELDEAKEYWKSEEEDWLRIEEDIKERMGG